MVRLPAEYQEVEYLESSGTQYIKTNYTPTATEDMKIEMDYMFTKTQSGDSFLFGAKASGTSPINFQCEYYDNKCWYCGSGLYQFRNVLGNVGGSLNKRHSFIIDGNVLKIDDNSVSATTTQSNLYSVPLYIFAGNWNEATSFINKWARIYNLSFIANGVKEADFIPCYRKSDSEPGMYDTVSGTFFTNAGTGTFLVGNDVSWDTASLIERRRQILLNTPHLETISDNPWPAGGGKNLWGGLVMANDIASATGVTVNTNNKTVSITTGGTEAVLTSGIEFKENTQYTFILDGVYSGHANLMFVYTDGTDDRRLGRYMNAGATVSAPGKTIQSIAKRSYSNTTIINYETSGLFEGVNLHGYDNPLTFQTDISANLKDCKIYFEPIQDLHGYDNPWPAGGGKNLWGGLVMANDIASATGVTVDTNNKTVSITTGGTEAVLTSGIEFKENTQYTFILDGVYSGHANLMFVYTDGTDDRRLGRYMNAGATVSAPGKTIQSIAKRSYRNTTFINYETSGLFEGVKTANDYEPYENICPITGWNGVTVTRCGKNLFNYSERTSNYYLDTGIGEPVAQNGYYITPFIKVLANVPVYIPSSGSARRWFYDENKVAKTYLKNSSDQVFTPTEDGYIRVSVAGTHVNASKYQIEQGSQATAYEPYTGTSITIPFPTEAGTVYGGYVEIKDGEAKLVVDKQCKTRALSDSASSAISEAVDGYFWDASKPFFDYGSTTAINHSNKISNILLYSYSGSSNVNPHFFANVGGQVYAYVPHGTDATTEIQICVPLATPIEYALDPVTLTTLRGINNIWSNANGNTEVKFWKH